MTLQLEEGKFYRARNGEKWGPVQRRPVPLASEYRWIVYFTRGDNRHANKIFHDDGTNITEMEFDLIAEWIDEPIQKLTDTPEEVAALVDLINHPPHYTGHPSGVECIQITEHLNFCCGNAVKYIWRAGEKGDAVEDLKKARWYIDREIARLSKIVA